MHVARASLCVRGRLRVPPAQVQGCTALHWLAGTRGPCTQRCGCGGSYVARAHVGRVHAAPAPSPQPMADGQQDLLTHAALRTRCTDRETEAPTTECCAGPTRHYRKDKARAEPPRLWKSWERCVWVKCFSKFPFHIEKNSVFRESLMLL